MKLKVLFLCLITLCLFSNYSQQTVKGKVVDLESQFGLPGVNVQFVDPNFNLGVATDINGGFKIEPRIIFDNNDNSLRDYIKQDKSYSGGIVANTKVDCSGSWKIFQKNSKLLKKDDFSNWDDLDF